MTVPVVSPDGNHLQAGDVHIYRVPDIDRIEWPVPAMFRDLGLAEFKNLVWDAPDAADSTGSRLIISFNSYVIHTPDFLCLVDAGVGNDKDRPDRPAWHRRNGDFMHRLRRLGFEAEQFDLVINTHLHADHVGWNTRQSGSVWAPTFPNARYVVPVIELNFWKQRYLADAGGDVLHGAYEDSIKPIMDRGLYAAVNPPCGVVPGLWLEPAPGHTPGMAVVRLSVPAIEIMFLADVLHSPIQLQVPDLTSNFCTDPAQARVTRRSLLERCAGSGTLVAAYHFPPPVFGRIMQRSTAYGFDLVGGPLQQGRLARFKV